MTKPADYSLSDLSDMLEDDKRINAYKKALEAIIKPDDIVVDLGAGTGILSFIACKLGAKKVYSIEILESAILIDKIAKANGLENKICVFNKDSNQVELPEKADVIISSIHGILPLYRNYISSIRDAHRRFLKPGGIMLPSKDRIQLAIVESKKAYKRKENVYDIDISLLNNFEVNKLHRLKDDDNLKLLSKTFNWLSLDHYNLKQSNFSSEFELKISTSGLAQGVCLWNDVELTSGETLSSHPELEDTSYGRAFLPFKKAN